MTHGDQAWQVKPGTYDYERSDGTSGVNALRADGTFAHTRSDGSTETGTWSQEGDRCCISPDQGEKRYYTFTPPGDDGSLTGTMPNGVTAKMRWRA